MSGALKIYNSSTGTWEYAAEVGIVVDANSATAYAAMNVLSWEES